MQGDLALAIELWIFESPGELHFPTFGSVSCILTLSPKVGLRHPMTQNMCTCYTFYTPMWIWSNLYMYICFNMAFIINLLRRTNVQMSGKLDFVLISHLGKRRCNTWDSRTSKPKSGSYWACNERGMYCKGWSYKLEMCSSFNIFMFSSIQPKFAITWQCWCICVCAHVFNDKAIYFPMSFGIMLVASQKEEESK
jgi:hypothetical protein